MKTQEEAWAAKTAFRNLFGGSPWLRGVGVGYEEALGYTVRVNVYSEADKRNVPAEINGVAIVVCVVGKIRALN